MASIIRVKRSTGVAAPSPLNFGEVGLTVGVGTYGNKGGRLFAGDNANNPQEVGGRYYTDMMSREAGKVASQDNPTTPDNGFIPILSTMASGNPGGGGNVNRLPRVDQWSVDNLTLDGNTISSNNTDGDIIFKTNGSGEVVISDDQFLTFGDSKDAKIEYDENGDDKVKVTGADWVWDNVNFNINGDFTVDNIGISSNIISTKSGGGNTLYLDPYPDGLSSDGLVIIKGSLQVDGTTNTVNSTNTTLNDPIINLGDLTSKVTVMATVASGVSTVTVDSVVGINTGDTLAHASIDASGIGTVSAYNATSKVITFTGTTTAGIATAQQITVTHAYDTNTDRGITFNYNTSQGTVNNKTGFFGYNDSAGDTSGAPVRSWTYIPDATVTGSVVSGDRGFLDIKGIYYQGGDWASSGAAYFDSTGKLTSTGTPASGISTSNYVLTTTAAGIPVWTTTLDGGTF